MPYRLVKGEIFVFMSVIADGNEDTESVLIFIGTLYIWDRAADKYLFEIGGKSKSRRQIREYERGFVIKDDIETGFGNIIPLWLFGFMY